MMLNPYYDMACSVSNLDEIKTTSDERDDSHATHSKEIACPDNLVKCLDAMLHGVASEDNKQEGVHAVMSQNHLKSIGKVYGLGGTVKGDGFYSWGGAAGTGFWIDPKSDSYAVFMIQRWGYKPPTYNVFKKFTAQAIGTSE